MSIEAICWAFEQQIKPSSAKFVLVCLADNASHDAGEAWPALSTIARKTGLDRKTVIDAINWLEEIGVLLDTGKRVGTTKQVKVYRLNGLPSQETHYVYRVRHPGTGEYYIGCRSSWGKPEGDDQYYGSGVWPIKMRRAKQPLVKDILATFTERRQAEIYEAHAITMVVGDPLCKNGNSGTIPKAELSRLWAETMPLFAQKGTEIGTRNHKEPDVTKNTAAGPSPTAQCAEAYRHGIKTRYQADYPPSAKLNGMMSQLVKELGADPALAVVKAYLANGDKWYVLKRHALEYLKRDAAQIWIQLQERGVQAAKGPAIATAHIEKVDGASSTLRDYPVDEPERVARQVLKDYGLRLDGWKAKNIIVQIGARRHPFSIAELRA